METIKLQEKSNIRKGIYVITLNRPQSMNAMNTRMAIEMIEVFKQLKENDQARTIILTGSGERSFCVGADLKERNGMTQKEWKKQHDLFEELTELIRNYPFPVIACINGFALGGGMEIALSCDFRVASENAKLGLPEAKLGLIPGIGGTQLIARSAPVGIAKEMLFRGNQISAAYAKSIGLVNHVLSQSQLFEETLTIASDIAKNAPLSLKALKKAVNQGLDVDLHTGIAIDLAYYYQCADSDDRFEGVSAFNEKREPVWKGN